MTSSNANPFAGQWWLAGIICVVLAVGIIYAVGSSTMAIASASAPANLVNAGNAGGSVVRIGQLLYSPFDYSYVLPFEIASIVILVAIVGAIVIGRED